MNYQNEKRKKDHLNITLNESPSFKDVTTGLEKYHFIHQALPEIDLKDIDLSTDLFGKKVEAPIIISPMVGGFKQLSVSIKTWPRLHKNWGWQWAWGPSDVWLMTLKSHKHIK